MSGSEALVLHGYWRSGTSYRTRIALNLKRLAYSQAGYDLRSGQQKGPAYLALNPQGLVPTLQVGAARLIQSPAILEWLEEQFPDPPLLPSGPENRAIVRAMAMTIGCDIHPLNNLRVLNALKSEFGADEAARARWTARWINEGFTALETMISRHGQGFAFGRSCTLADCYLVPQVYSAERFGVDLSAYPAINAAAAVALSLPEVQAAHPDLQPDASPGS